MSEVVRFVYENHRDNVADRTVLPIRLWFGKTDWYPKEQWFLHAFDLDKQEARDFAMTNISRWIPSTAQQKEEREAPCAQCGCTLAVHYHVNGPCSNCGDRCSGYRPYR